MKSFLICILTVFFTQVYSGSKTKQKQFEDELKQNHLIFNNDLKRLKPLKNQPVNIQLNEKIKYSPDFYLKSKRPEYIFGILIFRTDSIADKSKKDPNFKFLELLTQIEALDKNTKKSKTNYYKPEETLKLNANLSGYKFFYLKNPLLNKYKYCIYRFKMVKNQSQVFEFLFFKENNPEIFKKVLDETFQILTYSKKYSNNEPFGKDGTQKDSEKGIFRIR